MNNPRLNQSTSLIAAPGRTDKTLLRNFSLISLYQIVVRTGWIFKTESIVMPAVLDVMGGSGWLRGCLPMLNRFGQSIPPMLASDQIRRTAYKKKILAGCIGVMGLCFLVLSVAWNLTGGQHTGMPFLFLLMYGIFFCSVGIHNLAMTLIDGKLIPVNLRGRLMLISTTIGCCSAIACAWFIMRRWLNDDVGSFDAIFLFTGCAFLLAAITALGFREQADPTSRRGRSAVQMLKGCWVTLWLDRNFRRLAIISALFGMSMTLFPHYQALARGSLKMGLEALVPWVIAQSIGAAAFSIPCGWLADRCGNRLVLQFQMIGLSLAPIGAIWIAELEHGHLLFPLVFGMLGLTPITMRTFSNYALEITSRKHQPRYQSTLSLCMAGPAIVTSSLMGLFVDWTGFVPAFAIVIVSLLIGWTMTFRLQEPRHQHPPAVKSITAGAADNVRID